MTTSDSSSDTDDDHSFGDFVQSFQIEDLNIRGRLVRLNESFATAMAAHDYAPPLKRFLGETMALSGILASALKYDGVFTLQMQGDGPISLIMSDITSEGAIRAYAKPREDADIRQLSNASVPQMMGAGHLAFTVDQGPDTERYQGITELAGSTLAECAQNYFRQSEQLETAIVIAANNPSNGQPYAAALMVQRLPKAGDGETEDENWRRAVVLMSSITSEELLDPTLSATNILFRLYHEDGIRLYEPRALYHQCRCSEERVTQTLRSFPRSEIDSMLEDGELSVTCEFCSTHYVYDTKKLDTMFASQAENNDE